MCCCQALGSRKMAEVGLPLAPLFARSVARGEKKGPNKAREAQEMSTARGPANPNTACEDGHSSWGKEREKKIAGQASTLASTWCAKTDREAGARLVAIARFLVFHSTLERATRPRRGRGEDYCSEKEKPACPHAPHGPHSRKGGNRKRPWSIERGRKDRVRERVAKSECGVDVGYNAGAEKVERCLCGWVWVCNF